MASALAPAYNGGLSPWWEGESGNEAPPMLKHLVFRHSLEAANLPTFLKFNNAKKCYLCKKIMGGHETGEEGRKLKQNWGLCATGPSLRAPLVELLSTSTKKRSHIYINFVYLPIVT